MMDDSIVLVLTDGRKIESPLGLYPTLKNASKRSRMYYKIVGRGIGLHWPILDYDLSLEGMLSGVPEYHPRSGDGIPLKTHYSRPPD
jgi:hypothetical protein